MNRFGRLFALPWLILAILLQANAPAQAAAMAGRMLAAAAGEADSGMGAMPMCGDHAKPQAGHGAPVDPHKDCCAGCLACGVAHAAALLAEPLALRRPVVRAGAAVLWLSAHSPRGPPTLRPKARDPPTLT